ncbi:HupE/UreJ family protein [Myxosarcina sp. GI1]|uniref:HupE/UreJ family protein n=1 Tax=Myxosarcina sp. GI1 TaxID=1541065 RepID=UPI0005627319|nr:HupE/UreJ family protein [Myxosarcina sp. GI1]
MKTAKHNSLLRNLVIATAIVGVEFAIAAPAFAHHPLGGRMPANFFEGIISGLGHPMIGLDHLAFIIASGLMAVAIAGGIIVPVAFVVATGLGAGIHLSAIDLPIPEIVIAASVVLFGVLLVMQNARRPTDNHTITIAGLAALAGIFHGYAYGEGILGAEPTPLVAYLIGFSVIQLAISLGIYLVVSKAVGRVSLKHLTRFAGGAIAAVGIVFLSTAILNYLSYV